MNEEQLPEEVTPEPVVEAPVETPVIEDVVEEVVETERERNLKAENRRKAERIRELEEIANRRTEPQQQEDAGTILNRMSDRELESYLNNQQYAANHLQIKEILNERLVDRRLAKREEQRVRFDAELEVESNFPDVLNPAHPLALKTKELMRSMRLENHPQGRLIAARLAASELGKVKAVAAGRKAEQDRQTDVKANFSGEPSRPAPKVSDKTKDEELKKRAMSGDAAAKAEWFKRRGLI